jgi:hypothetical protein
MDEFVKDQFRIDNDGATESTLYCYHLLNVVNDLASYTDKSVQQFVEEGGF